ncbi:MAG: class I SAM-dependent methyltransferase [Candidatus Binatia bacterium]
MGEPERTFRDFEHAGWEDASVCAHYHQHLSAVTTQSAPALLDAAGVGPGTRLLDVATGAGYVPAAAALLGAAAFGVDFSSSQLALGRQRYPAVRFACADADATPFRAESFDAVTNGFGMCHLQDPVAALREAFRILRRGGRVAFTVWDVPERAIGLGAAYAAMRAHGSLDVGLPVGPNFFLFSDPEQSRRALAEAGFASPSVAQVPQVWRLSEPDRVFEALARGTVRTGAALRAQSPAAREAIKAALRDVVTPYRRGEYYDVPMPAVLASAVKQ